MKLQDGRQKRLYRFVRRCYPPWAEDEEKGRVRWTVRRTGKTLRKEEECCLGPSEEDGDWKKQADGEA